MPGDNPSDGAKTEELAEVIREIRERVRARHPGGAAPGGVVLPDLTPIAHARDAAQAKVAAIGTVNPRPPGVVNSLIQAWKKLIARALDWHVREQIEFNRAVVDSLAAVIEALNENNRALQRLASIDAELRSRIDAETSELRQEAQELKDVRAHWAEWRQEWEHKLATNEIQFLRSVADLQTAFQHRATLMETNFRDIVKSQHADFTGALDRVTIEIQKRLWADLAKVRSEFERLIHAELRLIRQRATLPAPEAVPAPAAAAPAPAPEIQFDYAALAERFRGSEESVRQKQAFYVPFFEGRSQVLDIGCGRGEFLELMREAGVEARGIDLSQDCVNTCREKGLNAEVADLFPYLATLPDSTLDGIFCAQVVEHLPPERLPELVRLCAAKLVRNGLLAIETPNPECLAIFATHFYLDPTHTRPVPASLLHFYMQEAGFEGVGVHPLSPAVESMPGLAALPEDFREAFFGGLDYAILGTKIG